MTKKINIISTVETNSFADSSRANNGGGYSQPLITFEFDGIEGTFKDNSCGDFGKRYEIRYNGKLWTYDTMSTWKNYTNFDRHEDRDFIQAIFNEFGFEIDNKEEIW